LLGVERSSYLGLATLAALLVIVPSQSLVLVFAVVFSVIGLLRALVLVANTVGLSDLDDQRISRGLASGLYNSSKDLGSLTSPALCGWIASLVGLTAMMVSVPLAATVVFFGLVALLHGRRTLTHRTVRAT
jgi:dipeptide/tripeptide permease